MMTYPAMITVRLSKTLVSFSCRILFGGLAALSLTNAIAQDAEKSTAYKLALSNFSHENTICSVYYSLSSVCFSRRKDTQEMAKQLEQAADIMDEKAHRFGKAAGLMDETIQARLTLAWGEQVAAIQQDCSNISILLLKYGKQCQALADDPDRAFQRYLTEAIQEFPE